MSRRTLGIVALLAPSAWTGCRQLQAPEQHGVDGFVYEATVVAPDGTPIPDCYVEFEPVPRSDDIISIATRTSDAGNLKVYIPDLRRWNVRLRAYPRPNYVLPDTKITPSTPAELCYELVERVGHLDLQIPSTVSESPEGVFLNFSFLRTLTDSRWVDYGSSTNVESDGSFAYWYSEGYHLSRFSYGAQIGGRYFSYIDDRDREIDPNDFRVRVEVVECTVTLDASDTPEMPDALNLWSVVEAEARSSCRNTIFLSSQEFSILAAPGAGYLQLDANNLAGSLFPWDEYVEFEQGAHLLVHPIGARIQVRTVDSLGDPVPNVSIRPTLVATNSYSPSVNTNALGIGEFYARRGLHVVQANVNLANSIYFEGLFDFQSDETITIVLDQPE